MVYIAQNLFLRIRYEIRFTGPYSTERKRTYCKTIYVTDFRSTEDHSDLRIIFGGY